MFIKKTYGRTNIDKYGVTAIIEIINLELLYFCIVKLWL